RSVRRLGRSHSQGASRVVRRYSSVRRYRMVQRAARRLRLDHPLTCWAAVERQVDRRGFAFPRTETLPRRKWQVATSPGKEGFSCSSSTDRLFRLFSYITLFYVRAIPPRVRNSRCASFVAPQAEGVCIVPK